MVMTRVAMRGEASTESLEVEVEVVEEGAVVEWGVSCQMWGGFTSTTREWFSICAIDEISVTSLTVRENNSRLVLHFRWPTSALIGREAKSAREPDQWRRQRGRRRRTWQWIEVKRRPYREERVGFCSHMEVSAYFSSTNLGSDLTQGLYAPTRRVRR